MINILMDSEYSFPKANKMKRNNSESLDAKIKSNTIEKKAVDNAYESILEPLRQQNNYNQSDIEPYFSHHHSQVMQLAKFGYLSALAYNSDNVFNNHSPLLKKNKKRKLQMISVD
ncbi:hypothetical protein PROPEN_03869 [Proteus penneri ATCC 35198]|nr:hypothetical protein PROPEN_03869 [Proteus penneri ATCC 35198]